MERVTRRSVSLFVWSVIVVSAAFRPSKSTTVSAAVSTTITIASRNVDDGGNTSNIAVEEVDEMMYIKSSFQYSKEILKTWIPKSDPCDFAWVACLGGSVSTISIVDQNLAGTLSPHLDNLTNLEFLILRNVGISGSIPFGIWRLQKLVMLDLSHNFLVGQVPNNLSYLPNLRSLDLSNNNLTGPMPKVHPSPRPHIVPIGPPSNQVSPPPRGNSIKTALAVVIAVVCLAIPC